MAEQREIEYRFVWMAACNMCGTPAEDFRILGRRLSTRQALRPQSKVGIATTIVRCPTCGLITANPLPIPKTLEAHYDVMPEAYWTADYFSSDATYMHIQLETFRRLFRGSSSDRLRSLDVGAGIGKGMRACEAAGFDSYGFEPSPAFRNRALELGIREDRLSLASVETAHYANDHFHFVNLGAVVEHFVDPAAAILKSVSWLAPGGLIYIEVPSADYLMSRLARVFYRITGSDYVMNISPMHPPYHLYEFTPESFELHGAANGYAVASVEYYPCGSLLPEPIDTVLRGVMEATKTGMQLAVWLTKSSVSR